MVFIQEQSESGSSEVNSDGNKVMESESSGNGDERGRHMTEVRNHKMISNSSSHF